MSTAVARMTRRAAWPTLTLTVLALLAVLGVLLLTGSRGSATAGFGVTADPSVISLTAGDSADVRLTISSVRDMTVSLATTALPPGVQLDLDLRSVRVSAGQPVSITGRLITSDSAATGAVDVGLTGRAGAATETSLIQLQIQPTGITDLAFPPPSRVTQNASFIVSGSPRGMLAPGSSLPIDLRLVNANPFPLHIESLRVAVAGTNKPACQLGNFSIVPYRGGYPLQLPAGSTNTLSTLHVPARAWPQLRLLNSARSWADCRNVTVKLRYAGSGSGG